MKIRSFRHTGVKPNGTFENEAGAVVTQGRVSMSAVNGGCGAGNCNCSEGHWVSIVKPRTQEGVVEGMTIQFDDQAEMNKFLRGQDLYELK